MRRKQSGYLHRTGSAKSLPPAKVTRSLTLRRTPLIRRPVVVLFIVVVVVSGGIAAYVNNRPEHATPKKDVKPAIVKTSGSPVALVPAPVTSNDDQIFVGKANEIISRYSSYRISVSVHDFATAKDVQVGSKERFRAASTAKLITATDYMAKVETGSVSLDTIIGGVTARQHLRNMLVNSDNASWNAVNEYMTLPDLTSYASMKLGIRGYDRPANMLNSDETNGILARLYGSKLLSRANTDYLLSLMKQANYRSYVVSSVPDGFTVYHKAGFYLGYENDAAIIVRSSDGKALAVTIYTYGNDSTVASTSRTNAFSELTSAAITSYFH